MICNFSLGPKRRGLLSFIPTLVASAALLAASPASAQAKKPAPPVKTAAVGGPAELAKFGDWAAYTANSGKARTCYALGKPRERLPTSLKRDPGYVFISNRPGESVKNEVSIVMGFDVKPESAAKAEMGSSSFDMIAKGANLWVKNAAEESQFIEAMRKNQRLVVKATSKKGNSTTDSYSLAGLLPAIDRIGKECQ